MRLKVISNGDPQYGTKVINEATGEELKGIASITWEISAGELAFTLLKIYPEGCGFDLQAENVSIEIIEDTPSEDI